jgi:glycosyltransferase involved in cell wall biosynthesis
LFRLPPAAAIAYNPVARAAIVNLGERSRSKVVFTGTLSAKKGIFSLIDAWPSVVARRRDAELHIYGKDGRTEGQRTSEFLAARLPADVRQTVFFHGAVAREVVMDVLGSARVAVFPSRAEAFAFAPLEAMACGCPTIYSTRCSGPELIDHDRDGLLIDPDDRQAISSAIVRMLDDDALAGRLGAAGAAKVRSRFATELIIPEILAFYERCAANFASRQGTLVESRAAAGVGAS